MTGWILLLLVVLAAVVLGVAPWRRRLFGPALMALYRRRLPPMSQTEKEAIDAGTVWWDAELFSGKPDWRRLLETPPPRLTPEEQAFLEDETEALCAMSSDWEIGQKYHDLPPRVWQFIKEKGFFGMIIPKQYGGKGFSAFAHAQVITKLASRCGDAAVTVMVPNSLGPAELLVHYGTDAQKEYYLPRLAQGLEIPCFALTGPTAGSDAASIPDSGVVCLGTWEGRETLGMRLSWNKRYITLGPVATLIGLAFRLSDPDHLLGEKEDLGITCALVPADAPGVEIGRRHMPLGAAFQNGPTRGRDVFLPLTQIIGGPAMAGHGWRMLMECLATGRAVSLPSTACGMGKLVVRATGAYARVRRQFKAPIGRFEGIEEPLARMGGNLYLMDAARVMTTGAIALGEKPSLVSAICKYHLTERERAVVTDAMDIQGGKAISQGPNNLLGTAYQHLPIGITVEGANILTRNLIIFGQGAIRCHPYVLKEMQAASGGDVAAFDAALFGHIRHVAVNKLRAFGMALTGSRLVSTPAGAATETARYYRDLTRLSAAFAWLADVSMLLLGGALKRRERISARLGDALSMLYLASATLKRYEDEGRQKDDLPLVDWAVQDALFRAADALHLVCANYPGRLFGTLLHFVIFPLGRHFAPPSDALGHEVSKRLIAPSAARDRLTAGMFLPKGEDEPLGLLEAALDATIEAEPIEARLHGARKAGTIRGEGEALTQAAVAAKVITASEGELLAHAARLRDAVIRVDDFPKDLGFGARAAGPEVIASGDIPIGKSGSLGAGVRWF
ncbi:MAG TPA: acyl-CoA dehydrogenase [Candidatus Deferrimicrobiaceae bacterium]